MPTQREGGGGQPWAFCVTQTMAIVYIGPIYPRYRRLVLRPKGKVKELAYVHLPVLRSLTFGRPKTAGAGACPPPLYKLGLWPIDLDKKCPLINN